MSITNNNVTSLVPSFNVNISDYVLPSEHDKNFFIITINGTNIIHTTGYMNQLIALSDNSNAILSLPINSFSLGSLKGWPMTQMNPS